MLFKAKKDLELEIRHLKAELESCKERLDLLSKHFWGEMNSDWMIWNNSKITHLLSNAKSECMEIISTRKPEIPKGIMFRGGPCSFKYTNLKIYVSELAETVYKYSAFYCDGELPEWLAKELFEYATFIYNKKGTKNGN